ncbi:MAG: TonB-dependent receptor [Ignavibacteria bacterium]
MNRIFSIIILIYSNLFSGITGKIIGTIKDANTKEPLIGANVILVGTSLGAATDVKGSFVILNIPPGNYSVRVSSIGYETIVVENVKVIVDQTTELQLSLKQTDIVLQDVYVVAQTPLIQKDMTGSISVITKEKIEALPVSRFTDILTLQAGVIGEGNTIHVRGGRTNEVAYLVDGMYVKDPLLGRLATDINNDAIQEMTLLSGTFNAEYGNAMSSVVNIVTREGTEKFAGKFEFRTSDFGFKPYNKFDEIRMNGNISGPLFTNQLKYFLSFEKDNKGSYLPFGYQKVSTFFSKLTSTLIPSIKITFSNRGSVAKEQNYSHEYKYIPEQYLRIRTDSWQSGLTITHTLSSKMFYDFRASYFNQGYYSGIDKDTSQYLPVSQREYFPDKGNGFEFFSKADPLEMTDSRTATADFKIDFQWQASAIHELKFGGQFKKHWIRYWNIYDPKRNYPYINNYRTNPFEFATYVQDKIEFPYLIINLGLRFDYLNANVEFRQNPLDPNSLVKVKPRYQFSPRVGIAHPISERTKLHFSYGHFFQNPDFEFLFENKQYDLNVREPLFGQPSLDAQRTVAYEVGLSHQFTDRMVAHIVAYYKDVTGLIGTRYYFPYFEGRYVGYTLYVNEDYANIKGLELTLDIRPDRYFSGGLTYTYSIAKGSASSETEQYPGTQESTLLYYLDFDKTHVLNATATLTIPDQDGPEIFGVKPLSNTDFSLVLKASSGYPYTPSGRDIGFVIKNSLRRPGIYSIDLLIGKELKIFGTAKLRLFAEIYNLTNKKNIIYVYPDTGDPEYTFVGGHSKEWMKNPANYGPPRIVRLGIGIKL